jgi:type III secretion system low calcium response chaperone LcrH/SycD
MDKNHSKFRRQTIAAARQEVETNLINPMVEALLEGQPESKLESIDQKRTRLKAQLWDSLRDYKRAFETASALLQRGNFQAENLNQAKLEELLTHRKETINRMVEEGKSFRELLGLTDKDMNEMYRIAVDLYNAGDYESIRDLFIMLTSLEPLNSTFWLGMAMTEQRLGHYDVAVKLYETAANTDPNNPTPLLYAANCLYHLNHKQEAIQVLQGVIESADNEAKEDPAWQEAKLDAEALGAEWKERS